MLLDIQHAVQVFANLVVASTMAMSLAIGVAGAFQHRFPLDCRSCTTQLAPAYASAAKPSKLVLASLR